jgi:hypothetical protein
MTTIQVITKRYFEALDKIEAGRPVMGDKYAAWLTRWVNRWYRFKTRKVK